MRNFKLNKKNNSRKRNNIKLINPNLKNSYCLLNKNNKFLKKTKRIQNNNSKILIKKKMNLRKSNKLF